MVVVFRENDLLALTLNSSGSRWSAAAPHQSFAYLVRGP